MDSGDTLFRVSYADGRRGFRGDGVKRDDWGERETFEVTVEGGRGCVVRSREGPSRRDEVVFHLLGV